DPKTGFDFTNNGFMTLFTLMDTGLNKNWATTIAKNFPMLFISGEDDPIGEMGRGIRRVVTRLDKRHFSHVDIQLYPNMRHEVLHEKDKQTVYQDILEWIETNTTDD
ncbi:alpha/beta hydrolase, partial [Marinobacter sp. 1Y8]